MKEEEIFLIDTNLIIYAYEKEDSERKKKSLEILDKCYQNKIILAISNQNLAEFSSVILKKSRQSSDLKKSEPATIKSEEIKDIVKDISDFKGFKKFSYKRKTILFAIDISEKYQMSFWDSLIAATMIENGILNIYTENSKDFKIPSLNVINPLC